MEKEFVVFWQMGRDATRTSVMSVVYPPHEPPRGETLRDILADDLWEHMGQRSVVVHGAVELPPAAWNANLGLEVATYDGQVASVECTAGKWRLVA